MERLLIIAQAVDEQDPLFGFFVPWLAAAARVFPEIHVLALRVGSHRLPANVQVYPLRTTERVNSVFGRLQIIKNLLWYSWFLRRQYDGVFVRGDAIYLVLAGWLWVALGKKRVFWYAHYTANWLFWIGAWFANAVVTTNRRTNPLVRAQTIGQHIDAGSYQPPTFERTWQLPLRVVMVGRVSPIKRVAEVLKAVGDLHQAGQIQFSVIGPASDESTQQQVNVLCDRFKIPWKNQSLTQSEIVQTLQQTDVLLSATPGSLDKVILEAAFTKVIPIVTTDSVSAEWPLMLQWLVGQRPEDLRHLLQELLQKTPEERHHLSEQVFVWARTNHELHSHLHRLKAVFTQLT